MAPPDYKPPGGDDIRITPPRQAPAFHDGARPSARELYELIAEAAYYRAEKRGFAPGFEAEDWAQAEAEVMQQLRHAGEE